RPVARRKRPVAGEPLQRGVDLLGPGSVGQAPRAARRERRIGHVLRPESVTQEGPHGRQLAPDRRRGELLRPRSSELGGVVGERPHVHLLQPGPAPFEPARELAHVDAVGPPRRRGERGALEEALDLYFHGEEFAAIPGFPQRRRLRTDLRTRGGASLAMPPREAMTALPAWPVESRASV